MKMIEGDPTDEPVFEVFFACDLKVDVPDDVIKMLKYLTRQEDYTFNDFPKERFFNHEREGWRDFLRPTEGYQSFPGWTGSELKMMTRLLRNNRSETYYTLSFRRLVHDDVEYTILWHSFLLWIAKYVEVSRYHKYHYVGYQKETLTQHPTLVYLRENAIYMLMVSGEPEPQYLDRWFDS